MLSQESVPIFMTGRSVVPPKIAIRCVGGGSCERHFLDLDFFTNFFLCQQERVKSLALWPVGPKLY
jgi:hypothetical protein